MSRKTKIILITLAAFTVITFIAQIVINYKLNKILRTEVLPQAAKSLGVNAGLKAVKVNLFGISAKVSKLHIDNPQGFSEPSILSLKSFYADVGVLSLLRKVIKISDLQADKLLFIAERNKEGLINIQEIQKNLAQSAPAVPTEEGEKKKEEAPEPVKLPRILLKKASANIIAEFEDFMVSEPAFREGLKFSIKLKNIATFGKPSSKWGTLAIKGHLKSDSKAYVTSIEGKIAPILDPAKPSFDIEGKIINMDLTILRPYADAMGITGDSAELTLKMKCRDGEFDSSASYVNLKIKKPMFPGDLKKKTANISLPDELIIPVPIGGTVKEPDIRWGIALLNVLSNMTANGVSSLFEQIFSGTTATDKQEKNAKKDDITGKIEDALKDVGDLFFKNKH